MNDEEKLRVLEERLNKYMPIFIEKKRNFRGVRHENSLSELQYTQFMVYKSMVEGLQKEIKTLKAKLNKR